MPRARIGAAARRSEPALRVVEIEHHFGPRLEIARVARAVEIARRKVARGEPNRGPSLYLDAGPSLVGQREPSHLALVAVLLREDVGHVLALQGAAAEPLETLELRLEDENDSDPGQVA